MLFVLFARTNVSLLRRNRPTYITAKLFMQIDMFILYVHSFKVCWKHDVGGYTIRYAGQWANATLAGLTGKLFILMVSSVNLRGETRYVALFKIRYK